jgi:antitoxin ParD1/3/4
VRNGVKSNEPVSVTLDELKESVEARVASGAYASVGDVIRAGLRALDREDAVEDDTVRRQVQAALSDCRAPIPADEVFADLHTHHAARLEALKRGA